MQAAMLLKGGAVAGLRWEGLQKAQCKNTLKKMCRTSNVTESKSAASIA